MLPRRALMNDKIVSAQGENLSLVNVKGSKLNDLSVYGKSMQSGTPTPENPVPIVSAGDGGEINVTVQGGNLFDKSTITPNKYVNDINGEVYDDISGTRSASDYINVAGMSFIFATRTKIAMWMAFYDSEKTYISGNTGIGYGVPITVPENARYARFTVAKNSLDTFMVNAGSTALPYEPYKQPQTLTIPTPGGLSGIPVSSGGNYTDENGQQWICDEVDLKRGKYVQRVSKVVVDGVNVKFEDKNNSYWNLPDFTAPGITQAVGVPYSSNYFPEHTFEGNLLYDFIYTRDKNINPYFSSDDELNAFCAEKYTDGQPLEIYYPIAPIETDLSAEEIAAYKALHTYSPTTTVSNDVGAWMKVGYREYRR